MKKYKLLKDLPTFKAGDMFYLDDSGNLCVEGKYSCGGHKLVAYANGTLKRFPDILTDWFEEIKDEWGPWRAKIYETYYYIDIDGEVTHTVEGFSYIDDWRYKVGNYFRTKEEAERAKAKLEAYATIKRDAKGFDPDWKNDNQAKCYAYYDYADKNFVVDVTWTDKHLATIYFPTRDDVEKSLDEHPDEWLLLFDLDKEAK